MQDYTRFLRILIEESHYDAEYIVDVLNNEEEDFMSFGDLLRREIRLKTFSKDEKDTLKQCFKDKGIYFNRNTLENWFNEKTPKKSDESRELMYKVAFALELDVLETKRLFKKVYKDRPFNIRRINEFVYYICIKNKYDYNFAQELIEESKEIEHIDTDVDPTLKLFDDSELLKTKESILNYIQKHYSSFCTNNISAKRVVESLINDIIVKEDEKDLINNNQINERNSILAQELCNDPNIYKINHSVTSISGMLTYIYNVNCQALASQNSFKDTNLCKEVIANMPTKHTFSKKDPSYEELRKMIVLLASYKFWVISKYNEIEVDLDDYIFEINGYLLDANFSELYPGNPFDWMFLWCSYQDDPLETFRFIFNNVE